MMRTSVVAAAVAAMVWVGVARAQDPQNGSGAGPATAPPISASTTAGTGASGSVSSQGYSHQQTYTAPGESGAPPRSQDEVERELRGVSVIAGGGVEGYTGSLAPRVGVGTTAAGMRPSTSAAPSEVLMACPVAPPSTRQADDLLTHCRGAL